MVDTDLNKRNKRLIDLYNMATHSGSNEHEAELAMTRMRQIMAEHDLAMADVEQMATGKVRAHQIEVVDILAFRRKGLLARYDSTIAIAVATLTSTSAYLNKHRLGSDTWQSMRFVGTRDDAEFAAQLFMVLLKSARHYARMKYGPKWGNNHSSFVHGFGTRLQKRADDWKSVVPAAQQEKYALILVNKETAIKQYQDTKINWDNKKPRPVSVDHEAFAAGYIKGGEQDLHIHKKVAG